MGPISCRLPVGVVLRCAMCFCCVTANLKCLHTGVIAAHEVRSKEAPPRLVRLVAKDLQNMGHTQVNVKAENKTAMKALMTHVKELRVHATMVAESPEYEPRSNGLAEKRVQKVTGLFRTTRSVLEHSIKETSPDDHPFLTWLVRDAARLHNRYHVGPDGRILWERVAGRRPGTSIADFGEKVMYDQGAQQGPQLGLWHAAGPGVAHTGDAHRHPRRRASVGHQEVRGVAQVDGQ